MEVILLQNLIIIYTPPLNVLILVFMEVILLLVETQHIETTTS